MSEVLRDFPEVRIFTHKSIIIISLQLYVLLINSMTQNQALMQKPGESGLARQHQRVGRLSMQGWWGCTMYAILINKQEAYN